MVLISFLSTHNIKGKAIKIKVSLFHDLIFWLKDLLSRTQVNVEWQMVSWKIFATYAKGKSKFLRYIKFLDIILKESINSMLLWCAQSYLTLCNHMECSLPGFSVHGILQTRILEWVVISSSRGSSWPRDWIHVSCIGRQILYYWATWEAQIRWFLQMFFLKQSIEHARIEV